MGADATDIRPGEARDALDRLEREEKGLDVECIVRPYIEQLESERDSVITESTRRLTPGMTAEHIRLDASWQSLLQRLDASEQRVRELEVSVAGYEASERAWATHEALSD